MKMKTLFAVLGSVWLVAGCTTVGNTPDQNPPKMVASENARGWDNGRSVEVLWDRSAAFGVVPANLQANGNAVCQAGGFARAVGYHPAAIGLNGKAVKGGGYLCAGSR